MVDSKGFPAKNFISIENNRQEVFASSLRILIIKSLLWNPDSSNLERRRAFWIERSVLNNSKENDFFVRVFESEGLGNQDSAVKWRPWSDLKQRRFWDTHGSRKLTFLFPGACYSFPTDWLSSEHTKGSSDLLPVAVRVWKNILKQSECWQVSFAPSLGSSRIAMYRRCYRRCYITSA